jgi:tetratricopeptide (TPR) repeat protein
MSTRACLFFLIALPQAAARVPRSPLTTARSHGCRLHALANRAIHDGAFDEAVELYDRALLVEPASDAQQRTFFLKALLYQRMGLWEAARATFRAGNRAHPSDGKLLQGWGLMESRVGDVRLALRLLRQCVACDDTLAPVLRWQRFAASGVRQPLPRQQPV